MQGGITSLIIILICCAQVAYTSTGNTPPKTTLSGKIIDKASGLPVPGVSIYFPNLKTGTISDDNGLYSIGDLPRIKVLVQVSLTPII